MSIVEASFPFAHSLVLRPGGEIFYKFRVAPPSKAKGSKPDPFVPVLGQIESESLSGLLGGGAIAPPLGNKKEFHPQSDLGISHGKSGKNGYGIMGDRCPNFTRNAKNSIRWAAAAIEYEYGVGACVFLTGTLPGSTDEAQLVFAQYSSWFVDRLNKWLLKHFPINEEVYRISVWELQRRGALHLHAVAAVEPDRTAALILCFQAYWIKLLEDLSDSTGVDLFARAKGGSHRNQYEKVVKIRGCRKPLRDVICYGAVVVKSVSAYLSKYLSKGAGDFKKRPNPRYYPARWWSVSRASQRLVSEQTIKIPLPRCSDSKIAQVLALVEDALKPLLWAPSFASLPMFEFPDDAANNVVPFARTSGVKLRSCGEIAWNQDGTIAMHDRVFVGFKEVHVGYVAWGEYSVSASIVQSLGEQINDLLFFDEKFLRMERRSQALAFFDAGKRYEEEQSELAAWSAIEKATGRVERSMFLERLRAHVLTSSGLGTIPSE